MIIVESYNIEFKNLITTLNFYFIETKYIYNHLTINYFHNLLFALKLI